MSNYNNNCILGFIDGLVQTKEIWLYGGYQDVKQKYRRTKFGPFWNTIIIGIFLMGLGPVYSTIFGTDLKDFFPYLSVGFIIWIFFSSTLNENCTVFQDSSGIIKQSDVSIVCYSSRVVIKNFFNFLHLVLILPLIFLISFKSVSFVIILSLFGLFIFFFFLIFISYSLALLSSRFRDIPPLITASLQVMFFFTPIIWEESKISVSSPLLLSILKINPLFSLMEIIRAPILGIIPSMENYFIAIFYTLLSFIISCILHQKFSHRVAYWI